jgi:hypothetical protein
MTDGNGASGHFHYPWIFCHFLPDNVSLNIIPFHRGGQGTVADSRALIREDKWPAIHSNGLKEVEAQHPARPLTSRPSSRTLPGLVHADRALATPVELRSLRGLSADDPCGIGCREGDARRLCQTRAVQLPCSVSRVRCSVFRVPSSVLQVPCSALHCHDTWWIRVWLRE